MSEANLKEKNIPRLLTVYREEIMSKMKDTFKYTNVMAIPKLKKIVINMGVGAGSADAKLCEQAAKELGMITGQKPKICRSRKPISNFKLREGMPIGVKVTLRRDRMFEFLEKLLVVAVPRIKDFRGISGKLDGRGNYTLGIEEQFIFPEIELDKIDKILGMNITFVTSANTDEEGYALLKQFGFPFKK